MPDVSAVAPREIPPLPERVAAALRLTASQAAGLQVYGQLLASANAQMNLVGPATLDDFWDRHVLDCGQLVGLVPEASHWADLGSGAGLPGIVVAILLKGRRGARVDLIESRAGRSRFLSQAVAALALPAQVHNVRAESLSLAVDVVTARACAPLVRLLGIAEGFLLRGARALFLKGTNWETEVGIARRRWRFGCAILPSLTDPRGRILSVSGIERASAAAVDAR
jgi:16S rRNA (guanine527-N7)-methyltransferase